ncbi:BZ3500_MvSof-1268-A1-R1_Chr3-3g06530 [Microbotryum saponariae]|uniref:BZ3500_MvSof-1268-A1-R1_Chr3-3g06530 protein n=1 Tax=Microbotryum saponariae TaxID=289078 RepID=A0A2X0NH78_9BASI|nr:BZ3500_MvSof-1268-A1-R1_Chr3-3g06530 [Microbotryum saponariae]SDA04497.1 BZ3501_MvSof-1269-A2-R1_Chr3-2g06217 [Microbotryum saponariae]
MTARSSTNKPKYVLPDDNTSMPSLIIPPLRDSRQTTTPSFDTPLDSISRHLVRTAKTTPSGRAVSGPTSGRPNRLRKRSRAQRGAGSSTTANPVTQRRGNVQEDDTLEIERNLLIELARERRQYQVSERRRTASSSFYSATAVGIVVGKEVNSPGGSFKPAGVSSLFRRSTTLPSPLRRHHSCYPIHPSTHQDVSGYHDPEDDASIAHRRNSSSCPSLLNQRPLNESPLSSLASTSSSALNPPEEETDNNETNEIHHDSTIDEDALFFSPPLRHCSSSLSARASATGSGTSDLPHYSDARTPPLTPSTPSTVIHTRSSPSRILRAPLSPPTPTRTRTELSNHYPRATKRPPFSLSLPSFAKRRASLIRKLKIETVIVPSQNSRTSTHHAPLPPSHLRSSPPSSASTSLIRANTNSPTHSRSRSRSVFTDEDLFGFGINQIASTSTDNLLQTPHRSVSLGYKNAFARLPQDEDDGKDEAVRLAEQREWHQKLLKFAAGRDSFEV